LNQSVISFLICPNCNFQELKLEPYTIEGDDIYEGSLLCPACHTWYRIENGIVDLLPLSLRRNDLYQIFAIKHKLPLDILEGSELQENEKSKQIDFFEDADDYEKRVVNSPFYKALDQVAFFDWIKRNLNVEDQILVLDVGCGTGRQCIPLAQHHIKTIGIDISEEMLILARNKINNLGLNHMIDLIMGDGENPPFRDNCFSACIFYGTLHHLPNPQTAIANASKKIVKNGLFYSLDPHKSSVRFIFDFLMKIWKIYDEEASDAPLLSEKKLKGWLSNAGIKADTKLSTYLPPHLFMFTNVKVNAKLLRISDSILGTIPVIRKIGGVIISEGVKQAS